MIMSIIIIMFNSSAHKTCRPCVYYTCNFFPFFFFFRLFYALSYASHRRPTDALKRTRREGSGGGGGEERGQRPRPPSV